MENLNNILNSISNEDLASGGSALQNSLRIRQQFLSNGNVAIKEEIVEQPEDLENTYVDLPECIKSWSLEEIFEKGKLSDEDLEKLINSHANDNFDDWPTDPNEMAKFLRFAEKSVKEEMLILKTYPLNDEEYNKRYNQIQMKRAHQLLAEFVIGQDLLSIDRQYGVKKGSKRRAKDGKVTKADVIKQRYPHLGPRQIRDFQLLKLKYIWAAIKYAFETGEELTRKSALSPLIKKRANNLPEALPSNLKRWQAKEEDFETEFKKLELMEEMGATSLFANIGVGTSLLEKYTEIRVTVANEWVDRRAKAHKRLYPTCEVFQGSITDDDVFDKVIAAHKAHNNKIMFISCPCQDSSNFNTAASKGKGERAALFKAALDAVEAASPSYVLFENVAHWLEDRPEFALSILGDKTVGEYVIEKLKHFGYNITVGILSAADYETGEDRPRAIILACKKELGFWKFPKKHKFRPTIYEVIGSMKTLEAGEVDPDNKWHYGLPLTDHEIEFLKHTPTGWSAWDNTKAYQPRNKDSSPAGAQFSASYKRLDPAYPCKVIESGSGGIGDVYGVHFGRPLSDGTYSDSRVLSIAEILKLIGTEDDFLEPLIEKGTSAEDFDGLTFENGMLIGPDERFIREVLGEHVCPKFMLNLVSTLPLPTSANDNKAPEATSETETADTVESDKAE